MRKTRDEYQARLNELAQQITAQDHAEFNRIMATAGNHTVCLTPTFAALLMTQHNSYNRPLLNFRNIAKMSAEISIGDFPYTGQGLSLTTKGDLGDGQHRCAAVIHAGKAISMINIVSGVSQSAISKVDHNMALRTLGDDLSLVGIKNPVQKGRIAEMIMRYTDISKASRKTKGDDVFVGLRVNRVRTYKGITYPRKAYIDFVARHDALMTDAIDVAAQSMMTPDHKQWSRPPMLTPDVAASVFYMLVMAGHDETDVTNFICALQGFDNTMAGISQAWLLHSRAMNKVGSVKNLPPMDLIALAITAGNHNLCSTKTMARWNIEGRIFPQVIPATIVTEVIANPALIFVADDATDLDTISNDGYAANS